jgi:hypothetical protein
MLHYLNFYYHYRMKITYFFYCSFAVVKNRKIYIGGVCFRVDMANLKDLERMIASGASRPGGQSTTRVITSLMNLQSPNASALIANYEILDMRTLVEGVVVVTGKGADERLARSVAVGNMSLNEARQAYGAAVVVYSEGAHEADLAAQEGRRPRQLCFSSQGVTQFNLPSNGGHLYRGLAQSAEQTAVQFGKA